MMYILIAFGVFVLAIGLSFLTTPNNKTKNSLN